MSSVNANLNDEMIFTDLVGGKIQLTVYLSNLTDQRDELLEAMTAWVDDSNNVEIVVNFSVSSPVDYLIDGHKMPAYQDHIDMDAKPVFDALKAEMLEQIKRIDSLTFEAPV